MRASLRFAFAICASLAGCAYAADEPGFYIGAGAGSSNVSVSAWDDDDDCCWYAYEDGDPDTALSAHVGYRFMPYFAVEVGYVDSGNPQWDENFVYNGLLADFFNVSVDFTKLSATQVSALGILPFAGGWEAYVRGGAAFWSADADQIAINSFNGALFFSSVEENDTGFLFGIGIGATPSPHWHLRLEYQTYSVSEDLFASDGDATVDSILFEAQYRL